MTNHQLKRRGPRSRYRPKAPPCESALLTPLAKRILHAASQRCEASRSDVFEHLLRLHGGQLTPAEFAPIENDHA